MKRERVTHGPAGEDRTGDVLIFGCIGAEDMEARLKEVDSLGGIVDLLETRMETITEESVALLELVGRVPWAVIHRVCRRSSLEDWDIGDALAFHS